MTTVTVCIPAYRAGAFIGETLRSVRDQTHRDLRVEIAVDPSDTPGDDTREAIDPFLPDDRFHARDNRRRLGWDANIHAMLERVETPLYFILPHDDLIVPDYVATLLPVLEDRPDACVAYGDMTYVGHTGAMHKSVDLPPGGTREEQLLAFFLAGAEAVPWRGLTRAASLGATGGFPVDGHRGFAVECEYALALLLHGRALRVPRTLYRKRIRAPGVPTASRERLWLVSPGERTAAWRRHRSRMLAMLDDAGVAGAGGTDVIRLAARAAMLRRHSTMVARVLPETEAACAARLLREATEVAAAVPQADTVAEMVRDVLLHHERASEDPGAGERHASPAGGVES